MVRKRFDVFNYHKNYIKNNIKYNNLYNVWEPITKILTKYGLKEILKKKINNNINKLKIKIKNFKYINYKNTKYNYKIEKNILNSLVKSSLNIITRNYKKEVDNQTISIGRLFNNNLSLDKNIYKLKKYFYLNQSNLLHINNKINIKRIPENNFLSFKLFKNITYNLNIKRYYLNFLKVPIKNFLNYNLNLFNKKVLKKNIWKLYKKYKLFNILNKNKKINIMSLK
jgi:hypothetical protein